MGRMGLILSIFVLSSTSLLFAEILVEEDLTGEPSQDWFFSGTTTHEIGTGVVLVNNQQQETGTFSYIEQVQTSSLRINFDFCLEPGSHGFGDGLAIGILNTTSPEDTGSGQGLFGLGNFPDCSSSIIVEFDTFSNEQDDFGSPSNNRFHSGIAYSGTGPVEGKTYLPTAAACDLSSLIRPGEKACLHAEIHIHENKITVLVGYDKDKPLYFLEQEIHDVVPFSGYLIFGASNGQIAGKASISYIKVENYTPPAPVFNGSVGANGDINLLWKTNSTNYQGFKLLRDNEIIAELDGSINSFIDEAPSEGEHMYELQALGEDGETAPPTRISISTGRPFLVVDAVTPGDTPSVNAAAWLNPLDFLGIQAVRKTNLNNVDLDLFSAVIWVNGSGNKQRNLTALEESKLTDYVTKTRGARLYMEGADLWAFLPRGLFSQNDGIRVLSDGWPATEITDDSGTLIGYWGQSCSLDEIEGSFHELPALHTVLWRRANSPDQSEEGASLAIAAEVPDTRYVVISSSVELCRIKGSEAQFTAFENYLSLLETPFTEVTFTRGDVAENGSVNLADAISLLSYLFSNNKDISCVDAADTNDNGSIDLSDAINLLGYLFASDSIPAPGPLDCGIDPTADILPACTSALCP